MARRVLVVDDDHDSAELLVTVARLEGHVAEAAHDGAGALAAAARHAPDVVFLDVGLPDVDGLEVARRMRALPGMKDALLVAVTGFSDDATLGRVRVSGFDRHMVKPVDPDAILALLAAPR